MTLYKAPLREYRFVLQELFDAGELAKLPGYEEATPDLIQSVLEEGGRLCEEVLFPLNRSGDEEGCTFENGVVRTPKGFPEAYKLFRERRLDLARLRSGVWRAGAAAYAAVFRRGDGLLGQYVLRHVSRPFQWRLQRHPAPRHGGAEAQIPAESRRRHLERHDVPDRAAMRHRSRADPHQGRAHREGRHLPHHRHQDLHLRRRARPHRQHRPSRAGAHRRRARRASAASASSSCRNSWSKDDGSVGPRNGVRCGSIEHKMGIKASSTCVINFEDAEG